MAKKKILFVVEAMGGGIFTYIVDLTNEMVKIFDIYVAYAVRPQTPKDYRDYFDKSIHLVKIKNFTRSINPIKDLRAIFEIKKIAKDIQPDIIHLHSSKAGVIGRISFNGKDVPLFYTPHGYSFLMEDYKLVERAMFKAIEAVMAKRNCTTISCSPGEHHETLKLTKKATYVNNGINIAGLSKMLEKVKKMDHPFTVFTIGRICYQKNPKLFNDIAEAMPETRFLWIGDGELRDALSSSNIEVTGWVDREEVFRRSLNADVFLLTSLWEGLPISLLESMYMKKLCVVNDVIGNHDVIHNKENGFVCRTIEEFKSAIETNKSDVLIRTAFHDIKSTYNTSAMSVKYAEIYGGVLFELVFVAFPIVTSRFLEGFGEYCCRQGQTAAVKAAAA